MQGTPEAGGARAEHEKCKGQDSVELYLHSQAPSGVHAASVRQLVVCEHKICPALFLADCSVKGLFPVKEGTPAGAHIEQL